VASLIPYGWKEKLFAGGTIKDITYLDVPLHKLQGTREILRAITEDAPPETN